MTTTNEPHPNDLYPHGYQVVNRTVVTPLPPPTRLRWTIGPVTTKDRNPIPHIGIGNPATGREDITMQLTADQQVTLTISGEDRYGNEVDISGDVTWESSDDAIVEVEQQDASTAIARAVGPAGTAAITVTNDADRDGTGDFMGSLAIDVVAGEIAEIEISAGEPEEKREVDNAPPEPQ